MAIVQTRVAKGTAEKGVSQEVTITTAQVLALNATPIQLVPAPGVGNALIFEGAIVMLDYATTAYDGIAAGEDLAIKYTDGSGLEVGRSETTGFLDQAADEKRWIYPQQAAPAAVSDIEPVENAAFVLHLLTAEIATGDSPLHVKIYYRVVPIDLSL